MPNSRYTLAFQGFEMVLEVAELQKLLPHEEIMPTYLEKLSHEIERDKIIKHPIIVDRNSMIVIDGNHRTEAMKELGYSYIPICAVDYRNPLIEVKCWYRTIQGTRYESLAEAFQDFRYVDSDLEDTSKIVNSTNALVITAKEQALISDLYGNLYELYEALKEIENELRDSGFKIDYASEEAASKGVLEGRFLAYIAMPPLTKEIIIEVAHSGQRFTCKTSRHILPARPMGIDFPLTFLKNRSLIEANREFYLWISKNQIEQIPRRTAFEGRIYDESIFLFH
ncbi:ParB N-terminal domain-containing protein [Candidatus Bathyarchaeota archaeon]|nr:ParB N-terminal domain-containing protein [Candidatus Bathyarchaeota archaeon]